MLYGDGVFETAFAWKNRVFKLDAHIERGFRSMAAIALEPPMDREAMRDIILEAVRLNGFENAYIKWLITRGSNGAPLMDPVGCVPNLIVLVRPYISRASAERIAKGLRLKTVAVRRSVRRNPRSSDQGSELPQSCPGQAGGQGRGCR